MISNKISNEFLNTEKGFKELYRAMSPKLLQRLIIEFLLKGGTLTWNLDEDAPISKELKEWLRK